MNVYLSGFGNALEFRIRFAPVRLRQRIGRTFLNGLFLPHRDQFRDRPFRIRDRFGMKFEKNGLRVLLRLPGFRSDQRIRHRLSGLRRLMQFVIFPRLRFVRGEFFVLVRRREFGRRFLIFVRMIIIIIIIIILR